MAPERGLRLRNRPFRSGPAALGLLALLWLGVPLRADAGPGGRTIRVPQDHLLISQAVAAARPGDAIEVDDGYYFEHKLVLDKSLTLKSKNLFGAVLYGSREGGTAVFIVRAPVDISGFVIRDSFGGILQRDSRDVEWTGRDLAFFGLQMAISVNDRFQCLGSARLSRLIIESCLNGVVTNEARRIRVERCLAARTWAAFCGSDHESFRADEALLWDCAFTSHSDGLPSALIRGTNRIDLGPNIRSFSSRDTVAARDDFFRRLGRLFAPGPGEPPEPRDRTRRREALILAVSGRSRLDAGDIGGAEACFRESLVRAEAANLPEIRWQALWGLARVAERSGDGPTAVQRFQRAIEAAEGIASRIPHRGFLSDFLRDKVGLYESLVGHLMDGRLRAPAAGLEREAFLWADRSKARGARADLRRAGAPVPAAGNGGASAAAPDRSVSRIQAGLLDPDLTPAALAARLKRLEGAEARRLSRKLRIEKAAAAGARIAPLSPPDPSLEELRQLVGDGSTAVLEYMVGAGRSWAFLMTRDGLDVAELPEEGRLQPLVANYLRFLASREPRRFQGREGGIRLRRVLLGPFESRLASGIRRLVVVPDGLLHHLPFETLPGEGAKGRFLIEDCEVGYAPSASFLLELRRRPRRLSYGMELLGLSAGEPFRIWSLAEGGPIRFPALPFAAAEVRAIGRMFPSGRRTILTGRAASEGKLKALPLQDYRIIHIAAHGFFQDGRWWRSAMKLRGGPGPEEDGLLQPADIEALRLPCELVTLSGCRTGSGELEKGEGLEGLTAAFFLAGARSLLLSLWSVNDRAAARFMESFYRHWAGGRSKGQALRLAKIEALRDKGEPPFVWAAFVLMGD